MDSAINWYCAALNLAYLSKSGLLTSLRRLFAKIRVNERNGDFTPNDGNTPFIFELRLHFRIVMSAVWDKKVARPIRNPRLTGHCRAKAKNHRQYCDECGRLHRSNRWQPRLVDET